jgi:hypothetical protein
MHLAQDNDMVYALTPDRSNQPFGKAILPGRGRCGRFCAVRRCRERARAEGELRRLPVIHIINTLVECYGTCWSSDQLCLIC